MVAAVPVLEVLKGVNHPTPILGWISCWSCCTSTSSLKVYFSKGGWDIKIDQMGPHLLWRNFIGVETEEEVISVQVGDPLQGRFAHLVAEVAAKYQVFLEHFFSPRFFVNFTSFIEMHLLEGPDLGHYDLLWWKVTEEKMEEKTPSARWDSNPRPHDHEACVLK